MEPNAHSQHEATIQNDSSSGIGLAALLAVWWARRVKIVLLASAGALVAAALFAAVFLLRDSWQEANLTFRVLFAGVEKGQYPNGMRFTPEDIVATPVLQEVYQRNNLEGVIPFAKFKAAFVVSDNNPALERLRRESQDHLSARALTQVERSKLEDDYESKIKATQNGTFVLVAKLGNPLLTRWPRNLISKVMNDILDVWAEQSRSAGVFKFDLNVYSENILSDIIGSQDDYLVLVDRLRVTINRILGNLSELSAIPGAKLVRVGDQHVSLGELQVALQDDLQFRVMKIESAIYAFGFYRNQTLATAYINDQLFRLKLQSTAYQSRVKVIDDALSNYNLGRQAAAQAESGTIAAGANGQQQPFSGTTLMPQLGDSFLNRLMELSTQNTDILFRQDLTRQSIELGRAMVDIENERQIYQRMLGSLNDSTGNPLETANRKEMLKWVQDQFTELISNLKDNLNKVQLLHDEISQRSLQPSAVYSLVEPLYVQRASAISTIIAAVLLGFMWCVYVGTVLVVLAWRELNATDGGSVQNLR